MRSNLVVQVMNLPPDGVENRVVIGGKRFVALALQLADLHLDAGLVDADNLVMLTHVDAERLADRRKQPLLVHLRVAPDRLMDDVLGDLAQFGNASSPSAPHTSSSFSS